MPRKNGSQRHSLGFLEALGQWTMDPVSARRRSHRSSRHGGRPQRNTEAYRQARLDNAPPGLNLTAQQWRQYADHVPPGYCTDDEGEGEGEGGGEVRQAPPPALQPEPDPFRSAWSHSPSSAVTRAHGAVQRRDSPLERITGRRSMQEPTSPQLRYTASFDANNDPLFANIPHNQEQRATGDIVVHQEQLDANRPMAEIFRQPTTGRQESNPSETGQEDINDDGENEVDAQSMRQSQSFNNPRQAHSVPQAGSDGWPMVQSISRVPTEPPHNRIDNWRNTMLEAPEEQYGVDREASVFGGSHVTVWPGPHTGHDSASLAPGDSATEIILRRHGRERRGPSGSRAGNHGNESSQAGGPRHSRRQV